MAIYKWNGDVLEEWKQLQEKMDWSKMEWETFIRSGQVKGDSRIDPVVYSSWMRCRDRRVDPYDDTLVVLSSKEIKERLSASRRMIEVVRPILHETAESIKDSGFRVDLYDADLYLLMRFGKRITSGDYERRELVPGVSQKEGDSGTTAVNLAALLERPVQLSSYEHYKTAFHQLTCCAVPFMKNGRLSGVIEVEGNCWPMHKHTLGLLTALKYSIEYRLSGGSMEGKETLASKINKKVIEMIDDAVVAADRSGKIVMVNRSAQKLMTSGWQDVLGFSCESVWGKRNPFTEVLESGKGIIGREIILHIEDKPVHLHGTIHPVVGDDGKLDGAVGMFKDAAALGKKSRKNPKLTAHYSFENLVGESDKFRQAIRLARETAELNNNVLIQGESGTGKELFAQAIHNASLYKEGPFVAVNCSAIPYSLLESELFGYEGGAFTGAKKEGGLGKFELAAGGTIFLDEINSMSLDMQAKILRVLQNKTVMRIGGDGEILVDVRIISAANVDLWDMVKQGEFREDLYYRINVISIHIPPLRERKGDVELLTDFLTARLSGQMKQDIKLDDKTLNILKEYPWPGNVRELENVLERCFVLAKSKGISRISMNDICSYRGIQEFIERKPVGHSTGEERIDYVEKALIIKVLRDNEGNIMQSARQLGIARNTLYRRMKRYGISTGAL